MLLIGIPLIAARRRKTRRVDGDVDAVCGYAHPASRRRRTQHAATDGPRTAIRHGRETLLDGHYTGCAYAGPRPRTAGFAG